MGLQVATRARVRAFFIFCFAVSWMALGGCLLTTNLSDLSGQSGVTDASTAPTDFSIGGTVSGLEGADVTLASNTNDFIKVTEDGGFTFPIRLAPGAGYIVTFLRSSDGRACKIERGEGKVGNADVTDVVVSCPSTNTELADLALSRGTLAPAFSPATLPYAAAIFPDVFAVDAPITVTATTKSVGATVTVNGAAAKSAQPSTLAGLHSGPNTIIVTVTAADRVAQATYTIAAEVNAQEAYIKASNTRTGAQLGHSVSLSADGNTLAAGARYEPTIGNAGGAVYVFRRSGATWVEEALVRASNAASQQFFGASVSLSADGTLLAVGAPMESSGATGINGDGSDTSALNAGSAYVFRREGTTWTQEVYLKASNARKNAYFGQSVAISGDGTTVVVGSDGENSSAVGINGDQTDQLTSTGGAAYVFTRTAMTWTQQAYLKASNTMKMGLFGSAVALSSNGNLLAVGSGGESGISKGINGDQTNAGASTAGAVYVFARTGPTWMQEAYVKASNTRASCRFGNSVSLSADGRKLAVGASLESSAATGVNGAQSDNSGDAAGAAFVFAKIGASWSQEAYVKASNTDALVTAQFGASVSLSADGQRLAVGARYERSPSTGINGDQQNASPDYTGAVYAYALTGTKWAQKAYVKASNTRRDAFFGNSVAVSGDGFTLAVGAPGETSAKTGINPNQNDISAGNAGAVYAFR